MVFDNRPALFFNHSKKNKAMNKTAKKYIDILKSGHIEEREIISLRSFLHGRKQDYEMVVEELDNIGELTLSAEQNKKGIDFLVKCWQTKSGKERKNNPFSYRQQKIITDFSHFTFSGLEEISNDYASWFLAKYKCYDNEGNYFEYYYQAGEFTFL